MKAQAATAMIDVFKFPKRIFPPHMFGKEDFFVLKLSLEA